MHFLPEIRCGGQAWQLPLSEAAARVLVFRQLDPQNAADLISPRDVEQTLLFDPAFALWCLAHQPAVVEAKITLWRLADWFLSMEIEELLADQALLFCHQPVKRYRKLATRSVAVAIGRMGEERRVLRKPKAIGALLHNAARWYSPSAKIGELPIPNSVRAAIEAAASKHDKIRSSFEISRKHRNRIRRAWPRHNTDWSGFLALTMGNLSLDDQIQAEKLAAIRQLAYGASHEINNPLANISTRAQSLIRATSDETIARHLTAINQQAFRAHEMIADLMFFAKPPAPELSRVRVDHLVRDVLEQLSASFPGAATVNIQQDLRPIEVDVDAAQLAMAIKAIMQNALEALRGHGTIWIELGRDNTNGSVPIMRLVIRDDGPGLSADARQHLFDPFFSGREAGRGLGFGLSKAWRIVQSHEGKLTTHSPTHGGAEFTIELPQSRADAVAPARKA